MRKLSGRLSRKWESLVGCLRLVVLKFDFLSFFNIEFGLGFSLFM